VSLIADCMERAVRALERMYGRRKTSPEITWCRIPQTASKTKPIESSSSDEKSDENLMMTTMSGCHQSRLVASKPIPAPLTKSPVAESAVTVAKPVAKPAATPQPTSAPSASSIVQVMETACDSSTPAALSDDIGHPR